MADRYDIQRFPVALLDLLGMKGTGDTPHTIAGDISLGLDITDLYLAQRRTVVTGQTAIPMTGTGSFAAVGALVPSGELWVVYGVTATLATPTAAATALRYWAAYTHYSSSLIGLTDSVSVGANDNAAVTRVYEKPAIFVPGDQFWLQTGAATGVPNAAGRIHLDVARVTL